ncbi:MAG: SOUL family heme-binding protein [Candidatus Sericytochromatia bacterium]
MGNRLRLLGTAIGGLANVFGVRLEEHPRHQMLVREADKEIRRYGARLIVTTRAEGSREATQSRNFRVLAAYIFGNNRQRDRIAMTTPVIQRGEGAPIAMTAPVVMTPDGSSWAMSFILPSRYTPDTVPVPNDPRIELVEEPAEEVAVIRFSGVPRDRVLRAKARELQRWLDARADYESAGPYRFAAYDPPFTVPFLRRNEIMIPVTGVRVDRRAPMAPPERVTGRR